MGIVDEIMGNKPKQPQEPIAAKRVNRFNAKDDVYVSRRNLEKIARRLPETVLKGYNRPKATPEEMVGEVFGQEKSHFTGRQLKKIGKGLEEKGYTATSLPEKKIAEQQLDFFKRVRRGVKT
jgi:hypothetical protein